MRMEEIDNDLKTRLENKEYVERKQSQEEVTKEFVAEL